MHILALVRTAATKLLAWLQLPMHFGFLFKAGVRQTPNAVCVAFRRKKFCRGLSGDLKELHKGEKTSFIRLFEGGNNFGQHTYYLGHKDPHSLTLHPHIKNIPNLITQNLMTEACNSKDMGLQSLGPQGSGYSMKVHAQQPT